MTRMEMSGRAGMRALAAGMAVVTMIVAGMCLLYVRVLKRSMEAESGRYLDEVSRHVSEVVDSRMEAVFRTLDTAAAARLALPPGERARVLDAVARENGFLSLTVFGPGAMEGEGERAEELAATPAVRRALDGERGVTGLIPLRDGEEGVLVCAVPAEWDGGASRGALAACLSKGMVQDYLSVESFQNEGFCEIIDRQGNYILYSDHKNSLAGGGSFFDIMSDRGRLGKGDSLERVRENLAAGESGFLHYALEDGVRKTLNYVPLEAGGWYLLSVVPTRMTEERTSLFLHLAVAINLIVFLLFAALTLLIVQMQKRSQKRLEEIAFVDPVTGGMNRARFEVMAGRAIREAPAGTYALVSLDLQKFKLINDSFGSEMGNRTLAYVHNVIRDSLRDGELVARISADTFNLLLKNEARERVAARLEGMVERINRFNDKLVRKYFLPVYSGVYLVDEPSLNMITIQDRATVARKNNKNSGVSRLCSCVFYTDLERQRMVREKEIDNRMQEALDNREFVVYLQPKVELSHGGVAGAEALVRWLDPEKGVVPPSEFIPVFEKNGFIIKLDLFVFEEVCRMLRGWLDRGRKPVPVSVNMSRVHLQDPGFLGAYREIFERYQIPARLLEIELTETLVFENLDALLRVIDQIHEMGLSCSLDDFGSGYSSLNLLKDVPADVLKLDRAFFQNLAMDDRRGRSVVESVVELARKLDMRTVSEGVESLQQVEFLRDAKCDMVQGFVFSKPLPVDEFEKLAFGGAVLTDAGERATI